MARVHGEHSPKRNAYWDAYQDRWVSWYEVGNSGNSYANALTQQALMGSVRPGQMLASDGRGGLVRVRNEEHPDDVNPVLLLLGPVE